MLIMFFYTFMIKIMMKTSIESSYQELKDLSAKRHHRLVECKQLHHFNRYSNCTVDIDTAGIKLLYSYQYNIKFYSHSS